MDRSYTDVHRWEQSTDDRGLVKTLNFHKQLPQLSLLVFLRRLPCDGQRSPLRIYSICAEAEFVCFIELSVSFTQVFILISFPLEYYFDNTQKTYFAFL
jgi:hypothetical protein